MTPLRFRFVLAIAALSVAAFVVALVLVHNSGHQTLQGERADPADPDAPTVSTQVRVTCASAAAGPQLSDEGDNQAPEESGDNTFAENDRYGLTYNGIDITYVSDACGRIRTERLTLGVELAFLGLLLGVWSFAVSRGRTWDPIDRTPTIDRPDDGAVL